MSLQVFAEWLLAHKSSSLPVSYRDAFTTRHMELGMTDNASRAKEYRRSKNGSA
jgi:hypothetical protein